MNEVLINNWNQRVSKNDVVIFLGDFIFKEKHKAPYFIEQLNGNITFIKGNHDNNNSLNSRILHLVMNLGDKMLFCTHFPKNFNNKFEINLVGHVHEKWKIRKIYNSYLVNVGVDVWKYNPVDIQEILKAIHDYEENRELKKEAEKLARKKLKNIKGGKLIV